MTADPTPTPDLGAIKARAEAAGDDLSLKDSGAVLIRSMENLGGSDESEFNMTLGAFRMWVRLADSAYDVPALLTEVERLREALHDIVSASRDEGLAAMCNWMRGRAAAALSEGARTLEDPHD